MSLDLPRVLPQVKEMGEAAARRARAHAERLPQARAALHTAAGLSAEDLARRIERAGRGWRGARPSHEAPDGRHPAPPHPARLDVIGADGSQILPDRHATALFFLVNIGSLHLVHGSGDPPLASSVPQLLFEEGDLFDDYQGLIGAEAVAAERDVGEMAELARVAANRGSRPLRDRPLLSAVAGSPALALLDNGLLLWIALEEKEIGRPKVESYLRRYWGPMHELERMGAALAGFVDRPRSADVLSFVHVAQMPFEEIDSEVVRRTPYLGMADRDLFADLLSPGERSALFVDGSAVNRRFETEGLQVFFFYLRTGASDSLARVEVPAWVAGRPDLLDTVHAGILEQCRITGIPYVLVRAHELAVVGRADRSRLDDLLGAELVHHGIAPRVSQKAETKRWTASRRRHSL